VGVDVPFGWPDAFVSAISAYTATGMWPTTVPDPTKNPKQLQFRATDRFISEKTKRWPLSVSCDRIAIPAMRAAALFTRLAAAGQPTARDGSGKVVEVYPAAALRVWQFDPTRYKGKENREARCKLLAAIQSRTAPWLQLSEDAHGRCEESDDGLDALIAALVARAATVGQSEPIPDYLSAVAKREGWIALPKPGALSVLTQNAS
jgi:predicted nuclease with RNAse H fold